jgi:hypothetical protein
MGAREDFEAIRHASGKLTVAAECNGSPIMGAVAQLMRRAGGQETAFIRLAKAGVQAEIIDLAWAVLGEERPGGPATSQEVQ